MGPNIYSVYQQLITYIKSMKWA